MSGKHRPLQNNDLKHRLSNLSPEQKVHLYNYLTESKSQTFAQPGQPEAIVALLKTSNTIDTEQVRSRLRDWLPSYAIPHYAYLLDSFPQLANGKIDKKQLRVIAQEKIAEQQKHKQRLPQKPFANTSSLNQAETKAVDDLSKIWSQVLKVNIQSTADNFFELGGDSILSIHVVSRMLHCGYQIGPNDIFDFPTLSSLARVIAAKTDRAEISNALASCKQAPLTPIQGWFFKTVKTHAGQWNQAKCYQLPWHIKVEQIEKAVNALVNRHDALRISFVKRNGESFQRLQSPVKTRLEVLELADDESLQSALTKHSITFVSEFDLKQAPLVRFILFNKQSTNVLLINAHHLIIDLVSWQILKQDLTSLLNTQTDQAYLARPTSFSGWSAYLHDLVIAPEIKQQRIFWQSQVNEVSSQMPFELGCAVETPSKEKAVTTISQTLDHSLTRQLTLDINQIYQTNLVEILLSALALCVAEKFGQSQLTIDLESHGRFDPIGKYDLSRTIGWFSSVYPVCLSCVQRGMDEYKRIVSTIKTVKETLRQVEDGGVGYGLLRQADLLPQLDQYRPVKILFNYLGRLDAIGRPNQFSDDIVELNIPIPGQRHPENERDHYLEIQAFLSDGQLNIQWMYDPSFVDESRLSPFTETFKQMLCGMVEQCLNKKETVFTPSDFPDAGLDQDQLDDFLDSI